PSAFTPTANTALWGITHPPLRILSCRASTITNGYATASSERSFHSLTMGSRALHHSDTVDLEKLVPHNSSVIRRTFRVDTPLITISIIARRSLAIPSSPRKSWCNTSPSTVIWYWAILFNLLLVL